jgi:hypothetical protein
MATFMASLAAPGTQRTIRSRPLIARDGHGYSKPATANASSANINGDGFNQSLIGHDPEKATSANDHPCNIPPLAPNENGRKLQVDQIHARPSVSAFSLCLRDENLLFFPAFSHSSYSCTFVPFVVELYPRISTTKNANLREWSTRGDAERIRASLCEPRRDTALGVPKGRHPDGETA